MSLARKLDVAVGVLLALAVVAVIAVVAVGGGGEAEDPGGQDLQACLAEQGVEVPDLPEVGPPSGGELPGGDTMPPEGGLPGGSPPNDGEIPEGGGGLPPGGFTEEDRAAFERCAEQLPEGQAPAP